MPRLLQAQQATAPVRLLATVPGTHSMLGDVEYRVFGDADGWSKRIDVAAGGDRRPIQTLVLPGAGGEPLVPGITPVQSSDLDFDGHQDLMAVGSWGATGNTVFFVWLFDPRARRFVYSPALSQFSNLRPDQTGKRLRASSTGGHAALICNAQVIEWIDGRPVIVRTIDEKADEGRGVYVKEVRERRGDRLELVRRETYSMDAAGFGVPGRASSITEPVFEMFEDGRVVATRPAPPGSQPGCSE